MWEGPCEKCEAKARADREAELHPSYERAAETVRLLVQDAIDERPSFPAPTRAELDFRAAEGGPRNVALQQAVSACLMFEYQNKQSTDLMEQARKSAKRMGHPDLADEILRGLDGRRCAAGRTPGMAPCARGRRY